MKKIQIYTMTALLAFGLAGCVKNDGIEPKSGDGSTAYLSIRVKLDPRTRASGENDGEANEQTLKSLYLVTFSETGSIVGIPDGGFSIVLNSPAQQPEPVKVSAAAKRLVAIANPGPKLLTALGGLNNSSTWAAFNAAITGATVLDIVDHGTTRGFTMISAGDETGKTAGQTIDNPYVDISTKVKEITGSDQDAKDLAAADRAIVKLERLASKVIVKEKSGGATVAGGQFTFGTWTVDALNTTYFPFAVKTVISAVHTTGDYTNNFYTKDPNYADVTPPAYHSGLAYVSIDPATYAPVLPWSDATYTSGYYSWKAKDAIAYLVENTMDATAQRFGNATRIVIKGTYTPTDFTPGADWFHWAGLNYASLEDLKTAYGDAATDSPLKNACDAFFAKIDAYYTTILEENLAANDFTELTAGQLTAVENGGEVVKNGKTPVIRWYQGGLNYYYYEIRHNNEPLGTMAFGKYGVVRNNWYNLTLNSVSGPGTPWYPDLTEPGEGDPDPDDPIDTATGYLGIDVSPQPWIIWETPMDI